MKCPNCGTLCKSSQQAWQERMQDLGRCIGCGRDKSERDLEMRHRKCLTCRRKDADRNARRQAGRRQRGALGA